MSLSLQGFLERWPFARLQCNFISFLLATLTLYYPPGSLLRRASLLCQVTLVIQAYVSPPPSDGSDTATLYMYGVLMGNLTACYLDRL